MVYGVFYFRNEFVFANDFALEFFIQRTFEFNA